MSIEIENDNDIKVENNIEGMQVESESLSQVKSNNIDIKLDRKQILGILNILSVLSVKITSLISSVKVLYENGKLKFLIVNDSVFCIHFYQTDLKCADFCFIVDIAKLSNIVKNCPGEIINLKYTDEKEKKS